MPDKRKIIYGRDQIETIARLLDNVKVTGLQSMSNMVAVKMILEEGETVEDRNIGKEKTDGSH